MAANDTDNQDPPVGSMFSLGWLMAQLYGPLPNHRGDKAIDHLPTVSELGKNDQMTLAFKDLDRLLGYLKGPSSKDVRNGWDPPAHEDIRTQVSALHWDILQQLILSYPQLNAYQLGRALSDTCWLPDDEKGAAFFAQQFDRYRLAAMQTWLAAATDVLPPQSAATLSRSLQNWQDWTDTNASAIKSQWPTAHWSIVAALRNQAWVWHALLAGQKDTNGQPSVDAWIQAGQSILRTTRKLSVAILRRFWPVVVIIAVATGGLLYLAIAYSSGTAKLWTSLVTVAAALGVSGASVRSAAAKVAGGLKEDIWGAASLDARAWAVTWLPTAPQGRRQARRRLASYGVAAPEIRSRLESLAAQGQAPRDQAPQDTPT